MDGGFKKSVSVIQKKKLKIYIFVLSGLKLSKGLILCKLCEDNRDAKWEEICILNMVIFNSTCRSLFNGKWRAVVMTLILSLH